MASWLDQHGWNSLDEIPGLYGRNLRQARQAGSFRRTPVMHIDSNLCTGCGACVARCIHGALSLADGEASATVRSAACIGCGYCQDFCPAKAMALEER